MYTVNAIIHNFHTPSVLVVGHARPLLVILLVKVANPLLHVLDLGLVNLHDGFISLGVAKEQVAAVGSAREDANGRLGGRLERTAGAEVGGDCGGLPGVQAAVGPHEAGGVDVVPAAGAVVEHLGGLAAVDADNVVALGREEEAALSLDLVGGAEVGDDVGLVVGQGSLPPLESTESS